MIRGYLPTPIFYSVIIITVFTLAISTFVLNLQTMAAAQIEPEQQQPNIDATSLFDTGQMILPENVKQLVILIPNEGHHGPGEEDEARFIAQPFVPQNVVVGGSQRVTSALNYCETLGQLS